MKKYAIAKTYGLTCLRGSLSYVKRLTPKSCEYTTLAATAILFDSIEEAVNFGKKKGWKVADHYIRSGIYAQEVDDDLLYNGFSLVDDGNNGLEKINFAAIKEAWLMANSKVYRLMNE